MRLHYNSLSDLALQGKVVVTIGYRRPRYGKVISHILYRQVCYLWLPQEALLWFCCYS